MLIVSKTMMKNHAVQKATGSQHGQAGRLANGSYGAYDGYRGSA